MYTAFYGLREKPFALSPDPRFLYLAASHREALAHLLYGIEQGEGFISVTGEVGTGKTTLCRTLLERLDGDIELAFLFNPSRNPLELLQSICAEFGLPAEGLARRSLMHQLNTFLLEQKRAGKRVLLIIDEAQTLSENTLEQVRLLSNLETSRDKLIQILLLGQPELDRKLDEQGLRQLRQRISVRWKLEPLGPQETRAYVRHRLSVAAGEPKDLFGEPALREVHRRTGGVPRLVNQLCDRALLAGYAARAATLGPRIIREAALEIPDTRVPRSGRSASGGGLASAGSTGFFRPWMWVALATCVVGLSLLAGLSVGRSGLSESIASTFLEDSLDPDADRRAVGRGSGEGRASDFSDLPAVAAASPNVVGSTAVLGEATGDPNVVELIGYVPDALRKELIDADATLRSAAAEAVAQAGLAAPTEVALSEGALARFLSERNEAAALSRTRAALLGRFGRRVSTQTIAPKSADDLASRIEQRGLVVTPFEGGSVDLLRRLDHPVALPLAPRVIPSRRGGPPTPAERGSERWVAITGFQGDRARVEGLAEDRAVTVPIRDIDAHWLERGLLVWESFEGLPPVLGQSADPRSVLWLQRALVELGNYHGAPTQRYDGATAAAVRAFQSERGLIADGVAGPLTQIALYAGLSHYPVPRLSQAQTAPRQAPAGGAAVPAPAPAATGADARTNPNVDTRPTPIPPMAQPAATAQTTSGDRG